GRMIDAAQLGKIAARIESSHDAEALTAARMLVKRLGGHGLRLADVVERGISGAIAGDCQSTPAFRARSSPPFATHHAKIDALLSDPYFAGEYATPKTLRTLLKIRKAGVIDP